MIYFDHAATTRVLPEAAQAAMKTMTEDYGNPSSLYQLGVQAAKRMGEHREQVARALGCQGKRSILPRRNRGDNWAVAWRSIWAATRPAHHHHGDRARRGASALQGVGAPGI
ncbi:MAG: aminotransferase class V-fold PLP-dependent enzyme [Evtepia gabavorous]